MDVNSIISYLFISLLVWNTVWFHQIPQQICHLREEEFPKTASFGSRAQNLQQFSQGQSLSCDFYKGTHLATCNLWFWNIFLWMAPLKKIHQPQVVSAKLTLFLSFPTGFSWILINQHIFTEERSTSLLLCLKTFTSRARSDKGIDILTPGAPAIHAVTSCGPVKGLKSIVGEIHLFESEREFFKLWEVWERLWIYWCGFQFVSKHFKGGWIHFTLFISSKWWI